MKGSSPLVVRNISQTAASAAPLLPPGGLVDSVQPNAVGDALRSGSCSFGSSGSGEGSFGGGVGLRFCRIGYLRGSGLAGGATFSLASFGLLKRSSELSAPFGASDDVCDAAAAFFLRSSASFASFEEPPRSFGRGAGGYAGTRSPCMSFGIEDHDTPANQSFPTAFGRSDYTVD